MGVSLLHYRPWRGEFRDPIWSVWPIARVGLGIMFRRKLFWGVYSLSLLYFLMYFFGQYLLAYALSGDVPAWTAQMVEAARNGLKLNGSPDTFGNFLRFQGTMVIIVLALAGSVLVGNDFHYGSLTFYLSKPLAPWHYLLGKCLAVAVFVNLMTTLPALALYFQYGLLTSWSYFQEHWDLLVGILATGVVLTAVLSVLLVAMASWLRQTIPLVMAWTTLFLFLRLLTGALVRTLNYDAHWRLLDLWNNLWVVGSACLGAPRRGAHPPAWQAAFVLALVGLICVSYLNRRIRAVEIVT